MRAETSSQGFAGVKFLVATVLVWSVTALEASAATLTDNPHVGPPTSTTVVAGTGYRASEAIDLYFDNALLQTTSANASGVFAGVNVIIPRYAVPELHIIKAVGRTSKAAAQSQFWVHTDWPQVRSTSGHTSANAWENLLNANTLANARVLWSKAVPGSTGGGTEPIVANGQVYVAAGGKLSAYKTATSAWLWTQAVGAGITAPGAMVVPAAAGYVVFAGYQNGVAAYRENGALWWTKVPGGTGWRVAAVVNGLVYAMQAGIGAPGRLVVLKATDGTTVWGKTLNYGFADLPAVVNGNLYSISAPSFGNNLTAYNAATGVQLWNKTVATANVNSLTDLAATADVVYVAVSGSEEFNQVGTYAFTPSTGVRQWFVPSNAQVAYVTQYIAAVAGGYVYAGYYSSSRFNCSTIDLLNAKSGAYVKTFGAAGCGVGNVAVSNNVVYGYDVEPAGPPSFSSGAWTNDGALIRDLASDAYDTITVADGKLFHWHGGKLEVLGN